MVERQKMNSGLVCFSSLPKLSLPLLVFLSRSLTLLSLMPPNIVPNCIEKNLHIYQLLINILNHISTQPGGYFICLFIPMFPFHQLFNFSSFSQTVNQSPPPGASHLSPCIFPSFSCSSACRSLFYALCLHRFPLILSLHLPFGGCVRNINFTVRGCHVILCLTSLL